MISIRHRDNITDILQPHAVGCELGVFEGEFSQTLWNSGKFDRLYLVDSFTGFARNDDKRYDDASVLHDVVKAKFKDNDKITIIKQTSVSFLETTDVLFDFIYIDTVHSYDYTVKEIAAAHKRMKPGGFVCGHDFCKETKGVIRAVNEFCKANKLQVAVTKETKYPSFMIKV
jgi:hypothetical protein